uniref:Uncharacterized protein n=1 Tax=Oryza sativa subsp. japonica TaxID=39947 RepID=Q6Z1H4_ORYSJ|nr:hypothetical protein [Oryza sativa Japonica Group]
MEMHIYDPGSAEAASGEANISRRPPQLRMSCVQQLALLLLLAAASVDLPKELKQLFMPASFCSSTYSSRPTYVTDISFTRKGYGRSLNLFSFII